VNITDDNIGQAFKQAFDGFEIKPSESVWDSINKANVNSGVSKPFAQYRNAFYGVVTAIIVIAAVFSFYKYEALKRSSNNDIIIENIKTKKPIIKGAFPADNKGDNIDISQSTSQKRVIETKKKNNKVNIATPSIKKATLIKLKPGICNDGPLISDDEAYASVDSMLSNVDISDEETTEVEKTGLADSLNNSPAIDNDSQNGFGYESLIANNDVDSFKVKYSDNPVICFGEDAILEVEEGYRYLWNTGEVTNKIVVSPIENSRYYVTVTNNKGQEDIHIYNVNVDKQCSALMLPSAFTPNGDGKNDVFNAEGIGISNLLLTVYSSLGQKIFETKSLDQSWDGRYRGELLPAATFFYIAKYTDAKGENHIKRGQVTLIR